LTWASLSAKTTHRMSIFSRSSLIAVVASIALPVGAQNTAYRAPRGPDGHPNINGIWQAMNTANWDLEPHNAQQSTVLEPGAQFAEPGGIGVVEGGSIPYKPEALAKRNENRAKRQELDPEVRCYLPGVPRAAYMPFPFQIFQSAKAITIAYEYDGAFRNIF